MRFAGATAWVLGVASLVAGIVWTLTRPGKASAPLPTPTQIAPAPAKRRFHDLNITLVRRSDRRLVASTSAEVATVPITLGSRLVIVPTTGLKRALYARFFVIDDRRAVVPVKYQGKTLVVLGKGAVEPPVISVPGAVQHPQQIRVFTSFHRFALAVEDVQRAIPRRWSPSDVSALKVPIPATRAGASFSQLAVEAQLVDPRPTAP